MSSSIHILAPPAPQQKLLARFRSISIELETGNGLENPPGLIIDVVVPAEEAGIVIDKKSLHRFFEGDLALGNQIGDDFRMMEHFEVAAEMGVVLLQGIVAVRTGGR